jgi:hypothetical protein
MRGWSIRVYLLDPKGNELPADIFSKVEYRLHPTFPKPIHGTSNLDIVFLLERKPSLSWRLIGQNRQTDSQ